MRAASVGAPPGQITTTGISARLSSIDHAPKKNPPGTGDRGRGKGIHQDAQGASILTVSPVSRGTNPRFKNTHRKTRRRIIYSAAMTREAIMAELLEIEDLLQDDRLNDNDRHALHGAQQALRNILDPETWHQASQTF